MQTVSAQVRELERSTRSMGGVAWLILLFFRQGLAIAYRKERAMVLKDTSHPEYRPGMILEWSDEIRQRPSFGTYVAMVGEGPFARFEVTPVPHSATVYGDERFRDGMKPPQAMLDAEARDDVAKQIGDTQRIKIHAIDGDGHHVSAEFPGHFFRLAK